MRLHRFQLAYFAYFTYLGAWGPYWTVYMREGLGFSEGLTGQLALLLVLSLIAGAMLVARVADARRWRRALQRTLSLLALGVCALWPLVEGAGTAALLIALQGATAHVQVSLLDATTVDGLQESRGRFGHVRLFGTLGFGVSVLLVGLTRGGHPQVIVGSATGALALFHLTTWLLPDTQEPSRRLRPRLDLRAAFSSLPLGALLLATLLHGIAFAPMEIFGALHLGDIGLSTTEIGVLFGIGIGSEALILMGTPTLLRRFPPHVLATAALLVTSLRWLMLASLRNAIPLMALQLTHGLSFGLWYASSLHVMGLLVDREVRTTGQALFSLTLSLGFGLGGFLTGISRAAWGGERTFQLAAMVTATSFLVLVATGRAFRSPAPVGAAGSPTTSGEAPRGPLPSP